MTDAEVDAFIEQQGGAQTLLQNSVLDLEGLRSQAHDFLVATALGRKAAPGLAVTVDLVGAPNRTDAEAKARTLAAGGPAADALFNDARTARKGVQVAAATDTQNAGSVVFGTPVGDVVAYQPDPQQATWNVFRVTDRQHRRPRAGRPGHPVAAAALPHRAAHAPAARRRPRRARQPALRRVGPGLAARRPGEPDGGPRARPRSLGGARGSRSMGFGIERPMARRRTALVPGDSSRPTTLPAARRE